MNTLSTSLNREQLGGIQTLLIGGVAGLVGGVAMAMFAMLVAVGHDGFWAPVRGITSVVFGDQHYGGGFAFWPVVVGLVGHMMNAFVLGVLLGLLALLLLPRVSRLTLLAIGVLYGVALWIVMVLIVANGLQASGLFVEAVPQWAWLVGHMMFGAIAAAIVLAGESQTAR